MRGLTVGEHMQSGRVGRVRWMGILILLIAIFPSSIIYAADADSVSLMVGRSTIVDTGSPIARVSLTSPDIADALVTAPNELLINGKTPGTISMFVWDRAGAIRRYEVTVQRDLARLTAQYGQLFPGESITAHSSGKAVVLSGKVSSQQIADKAKEIAAGYVEKKEEVVSLLQISESGAGNQVLLRVRFAEVSRNALTQMGASWFSDGYRNTVGSISTQQFPTPFFDANKAQVGAHTVFSDYLNLFLFDFSHGLGAVIKALQAKGLFQSLAEPNLVAENGKEASFLAGGEFPIPVAQASGSNLAITIQFKEFGVRLNFTPQITGDRIHLHVRPEVSTLDFNNAIQIQGFRIPALSTRRAETDVELINGQTFAIAGLMNNTIANSLQKVPGIGDIPILGQLFRSRNVQKDQTELVVMITPEILARNSPGVTPNMPRGPETFLPPLPPKQSREMPPPAFGRSREMGDASPAQAPGTNSTAKPAENDPAAAAATVNALTPSTPKVTSAPAPAAAAPAATARPLTKDEQAALERAKKVEAAESRQSARQAEIDKKQAEKDAKAKAEAERRQAAIDKAAEEAATKRAAEKAKKDAEIARKQAEQDRKQAELDKKKQKALGEAQAKMKAAQAEYDAEIAKIKKEQDKDK